MIAPILAALFPQWRDRDERLCREIVARGICAPTEDLGIAVRATLARVDALRVQRNDMCDQVVELRKRLDVAEKAPNTASGDALAACMGLLGVKTYTGLTAAIKALRDETDTLRGIHRDMLRVVGERDDARAELAALRAGIRDVAERMASNG